MTNPTIPLDRWQPLSVKEVCDLFDGAPFQWAVAGGYAIELFLGRSIRAHDDTDVLIFRDEQHQSQQWLSDWRLYAADPPGTLRLWNAGEYLPAGINDVWMHHPSVEAWQFQFMISEVEGEDWVSKRSPLIRGKRGDLITTYKGVPCLRAEVQLLYKAKGQRPKDEQDFHACLPQMSSEAKVWLKDKLTLLYPQGHDWLAHLG